MKVLAGDWKQGMPVLWGKSDLTIAAGLFRSDKYQLSQIRQFDIVTEENRASVLAKVGWGAAGAVALGPLGLLIGVFGGGNRRNRVFSLVFDDGRKVLIKGNAKDAERLIAATYARQPAPPPLPLTQST